MELTFELAEKFLAAQPFSVLLGARLTAFGEGGATLELDIRDDLKQQNGYLHGGVLGYAADNAITFAAGAPVCRRAGHRDRLASMTGDHSAG